MAEEERGDDVDHQSNESKRVGRDAGERQPIHDAVQKPAAGTAKSASPGHSKSSLLLRCAVPCVARGLRRGSLIVDRRQFQNFKLAFAVGRYDRGHVAHLLAHNPVANG